MSPKQFDVVVMGGGLVGATLALALKDTNIRIAVVDVQQPSDTSVPDSASSEVDNFEPRVSALTHASVDLLSQVDVWPQIAPNLVLPYQKMQVWDELGTAEIKFDAAELHADSLGYIVENQSMLLAMHKCLAEQKNVECFWGAGLTRLVKSPDGYELYVGETLHLHAKLVIGADGANSRVRQLTNLPTREWDYEHQAIVCTVKTEAFHGGIARQRFSEVGPLAFLPLKDGNDTGQFCSIVWSLDSQESKRVMALSDNDFMSELERAIEGQLGAVIETSKRFSFPLRQRHAKEYVGENVVLVGDAAHTIHPLAGQGVNLGFKDIAVLSRLLQEAANNELPLNHPSVLKRYQRERQGDNLMMMGAMEGFKQLFGSTNPLVRWTRNTGLGLVNKHTLIKNQLAKHAMGL